MHVRFDRTLRGCVVGGCRALGFLAVVGLAGCQNDGRISVDQLARMEMVAAEEPDVEVPAEQVALAEVQPYQVLAGDILLITMYGLTQERHASTQLELRVHDDGTVTLPIVGEVEVVGKTLGEVEATIRSAHVPDVVTELSVFVRLADREETTVLVLGAVGAPGLVKLSQNERNPLYALASAGGFLQSGSGRVKVKPINPRRPQQTYDLHNVNDIRRALLAPPLQSGDILLVEGADAHVVYAMGLLNAPGPIEIPANTSLSVMRAIAASGGLVDFLEPEEATLWRRMDDGRQVRVKLDIAAIQQGDEPDIALRAGDVLDVPHTAKTRFRQWVAQNIVIGPFGVTSVWDPVADRRARILRDDQNDNLFRRTLLQSLGSGIADLVVPPVTPVTPVAP